ncbi:Zn-dependent hydrolase [Salinigranum halophilum]|uniref:Zn-dependent hydrolase n=1 Tax=Salinigranum halophilum TaxID=2565931 RepID=UPI0010A76C43|nr:Zn-dependent hydrolase [Salinigranum halophilum]
MNDITIDRERLWSSLQKLGEIGETDDGAMVRVTGSPADAAARDTVVSWFEDAGMNVTVDAVGNIKARLPGTTDEDPVMTGSHIDTVPHGGKFDGVVGVLAPLEVVRAWNDAGITPERPLDIVVFTEEEGTRFGVGLLGSLVATGKLALADALELSDGNETVRECLASIGYNGAGTIDLSSATSFLEIHVEQGPILDESEIDVGIVDAVAGITHHRVVFEGTADHAGNTPMDMRRDAYLGAAQFALELESIATSAGEHSVGTVGKSTVSPNGTNVVPGRVELGVDIRDIDSKRLSHMIDDAKAAATNAADARGLDVRWETLLEVEPTDLSAEIRRRLERAANSTDSTYRTMLSGAGHDAMNVAETVPTGMLFVPSEEGLSHTPEEFTSPEDLYRGTRVLEAAIRDLVGGPHAVSSPLSEKHPDSA